MTHFINKDTSQIDLTVEITIRNWPAVVTSWLGAPMAKRKQKLKEQKEAQALEKRHVATAMGNNIAQEAAPREGKRKMETPDMEPSKRAGWRKEIQNPYVI